MNASYAGQRAIKIGVKLRFLQADDKPRVKELCQQFFPIDYPERWYNDITSDKKYFALSAVLHGIIVGVIVAEVKCRSVLNKDDQDLLAPSYPPGTKVAYLLSLGVLSEYRENGIGSLLVDSLITELRGKDKYSIKAVYLHVLCSNTRAIHFYEKRDFVQNKMIPGYYSINGSEEDGYCYARYINGGQPPWSVGDYMKQVTSMFTKLNSCSASHRSVVKTSSQSVHNYASNVLAKIPKLLPSLPKFPTLFTAEQEIGGSDPIVEQNQLYCDVESGVGLDSAELTTSDSGIHMSPTSSASGGSRDHCSSLDGASGGSGQDPGAICESGHCHGASDHGASGNSSSDEEYHDSVSSPTDLRSSCSDTECEEVICDQPTAEGGASTSKNAKLKLKNFYPSKTTQQKLSKMVTKGMPSMPKIPAGLKSLLGDEEHSGGSTSNSSDEDDPTSGTSSGGKSHRRSMSLSARIRNLNLSPSETYPILDNESCTLNQAVRTVDSMAYTPATSNKLTMHGAGLKGTSGVAVVSVECSTSRAAIWME